MPVAAARSPADRPVADKQELHLSRRERQIMHVIYERNQATAAEVMAGLPEAPGYSAVRALLGILEQKGHLKHKKDGVRYVYLPTRPREHAGRAALQRVLRTFFDGSTEKAVAALLDIADAKLTKADVARLTELIKQAKKEGR